MAKGAKKAVKVTKMTTPELVKAIATKGGVSQKSVKEVMDAAGEVFKDCAATGREFNMFGFGKLVFAEVKGKAERFGVINPQTGEKGQLPATDSYSKPVFRISKSLMDSIKEATKARPFIKE